MSAANITISVDGVDDFKRSFSRLDANFDDLTPIWPDVRDEFWKIEGEQFDSEGSKGGSGKWPALSERYALRKIKQYGAGLKILEATGDLKRSLTGDNPDSVYETTPKQIAVGTSIPYAMYHHRGSGNLKERKVISFSEVQRRRMQKIIQGSLIKQLRTGRYYVPVFERAF